MEGFFFFAFMAAVTLTWLEYRHQQKMKELDHRGPPPQLLQAAQHQVHAPRAARGELEERIRNLETIVCSVDFELNAKLNRLASQQLAMSHASRASAEMAETAALSLGSIKPGSRVASAPRGPTAALARLVAAGAAGPWRKIPRPVSTVPRSLRPRYHRVEHVVSLRREALRHDFRPRIGSMYPSTTGDDHPELRA